MTTLFLTDYDSHLLAEGNHYRSYEKLGAHVCEVDGVAGTHFAVIAPSASAVAVIGDFNGWEESADPMARREAGLWTRFVPGVQPGALYKYRIRSAAFQGFLEKADPYGFWAEQRPQTASRVCDLSAYQWQDSAWMAGRGARNRHDSPISIYEVHLGSWRRVPEEGGRWLTYRELAERLADYVEELGFTHVELLPISEHPFDGSWGYQTTGYYAPTSRFGSPLDFMAMVDYLHQRGIGVILDWAPAHFPNDPHGLSWFDGTYFYEHMDPRQGTHPHWNTLVFNYGRWEVRNFLISSALFWLDRYHIDGLRVDAVASMLYLDYGRDQGGWVPNPYGGRENVDAVEFLQRLNHEVYGRFPDVLMVAEESTAWPNVSRPTFQGGLGFGFKWNMGWMHDTLSYMRHEPVHRAYHHDQLTFSLVYAHTENFVLPFSHDEVVHGKGSLIGKMSGDDWQKYANLRLLFGYMFAHPGKKLLFMGGEFGQHREWNHDRSLDWHLLDEPAHRGLQRWVGDLNAQLRAAPALFQLDNEPAGFRWIDCHDRDRSLLSFWRLGTDPADRVLVACNFTPVPRYDYVVGVPTAGEWEERLNSDADRYGGSGMGNLGRVWTSPSGAQGEPYSVRLTLPPLAVLFLGPKAP